MFYRVALLASLLFAINPTPSRAIDWIIHTVDAEQDTGYRPALALDNYGTPHIFYTEHTDNTNWHFRYATRGGAGWSLETVSENWSLGGADAIILSDGTLAVASGESLIIRSGQNWIWEQMNTLGGWCVALALQPDGDVQGIGQDSWGSGAYIGFVEVAERHEGVWSGARYILNTVFWPYDPSLSLVVDSNDNAHASSTTTAGDPLRYLHRENGAWSIHDLVPGMWSSIALDAQGSPRISFYDYANHDLVMATLANGEWTLTPLDVAGDVGLYTSQVVVNNVSYVTYYDKTIGDLKLAAFTGPTEPFTYSAIDIDGDVGAWTSLAVDAQGNLHVAYLDVINGDLKYAVGTRPLPVRKATLGQIKAMYRR